jgi:hypothetical protein
MILPTAIMGSGPAPNPPKPLSDAAIRMIHAGLVIPNEVSILSMSREILASRGDPHPDAV